MDVDMEKYMLGIILRGLLVRRFFILNDLFLHKTLETRQIF